MASIVSSSLAVVGASEPLGDLGGQLWACLASSLPVPGEQVVVLGLAPTVVAIFDPAAGARRLAPAAAAADAAARRAAPRPRGLSIMAQAVQADFEVVLALGEATPQLSNNTQEVLQALLALRSEPGPLAARLATALAAGGAASAEAAAPLRLRLTRPWTRSAAARAVTGPWTACGANLSAACSPVVPANRSREVWCADVTDLRTRVADVRCRGAILPLALEACPASVPQRPPCGWAVGAWSDCGGQCGTQRRSVLCLQLQDEGCQGLEPEAQRQCGCQAEPTGHAVVAVSVCGVVVAVMVLGCLCSPGLRPLRGRKKAQVTDIHVAGIACDLGSTAGFCLGEDVTDWQACIGGSATTCVAPCGSGEAAVRSSGALPEVAPAASLLANSENVELASCRLRVGGSTCAAGAAAPQGLREAAAVDAVPWPLRTASMEDAPRRCGDGGPSIASPRRSNRGTPVARQPRLPPGVADHSRDDRGSLSPRTPWKHMLLSPSSTISTTSPTSPTSPSFSPGSTTTSEWERPPSGGSGSSPRSLRAVAARPRPQEGEVQPAPSLRPAGDAGLEALLLPLRAKLWLEEGEACGQSDGLRIARAPGSSTRTLARIPGPRARRLEASALVLPLMVPPAPLQLPRATEPALLLPLPPPPLLPGPPAQPAALGLRPPPLPGKIVEAKLMVLDSRAYGPRHVGSGLARGLGAAAPPWPAAPAPPKGAAPRFQAPAPARSVPPPPWRSALGTALKAADQGHPPPALPAPPAPCLPPPPWESPTAPAPPPSRAPVAAAAAVQCGLGRASF